MSGDCKVIELNNNNDTNVKVRPKNRPITNKSAALVKAVRDKFAKVCEKESNEFDELDIKKIYEDDWYVKRFLIARDRNVEEALKMIVATLKWRKQENFRYIPKEYWPQEFYVIGGFFAYEPDLEGNTTLHIRAKLVRKIGILNQYLIKFCSKIFYDMEERTNGAGINIVIDFSGCCWQNAEFSLIQTAIHVLRTYFPAGLNLILAVDVPFYMRACYQFIKTWIPDNRRKLLKFVTRKNITEYIALENLPAHLGGTCPIPYKGYEVVPEGSPDGFAFCESEGHSKDLCYKLLELYKDTLAEEGITLRNEEYYKKV